MKKTKNKIVIIALIMFSIILIATSNVFAEELKVQIVKTDSNYVIYVDGMLKETFKYAVSDSNIDPDSIELSYINSVADEDGNNVALLENTAKYLYVKTSSSKSVVELNFDDVISIEEIAQIEDVTNIIPTKTISIVKKDEEKDGVKYEETIGALQITEEIDKNVSYEYVIEKLPSSKYDSLKPLLDEFLNKYNSNDMYNKIELAKRFRNQFQKMVEEAKWQEVENMIVEQLADSKADDEFVVLLKKTSKDKTTVYDLKLMKAGMSEVKPEITQVTNVIKRTSKLPITGDSLVLFGILAVIVIAIVFVIVRMRKIKFNGKH